MKIKTMAKIAGLALAATIGLKSTLYTINEREQAVITSLGEPVRVVLGESDARTVDKVKQQVEQSNKEKGTGVKVAVGPGLYTKKPWHSVNRITDALVCFDTNPESVLSADKKSGVVDYFFMMKVVDPLRFNYSLRTMAQAKDKLDGIVYGEMYKEVGKYNQIESIRTSGRKLEYATGFGIEDSLKDTIPAEKVTLGRDEIFSNVVQNVNAKVEKEYGVRIVDVRPKRFELLPENESSIYNRMKSERGRIAEAYRSDGRKEAQRITSSTDREVEVITAEAYRKAEQVRGQADAEALKIYADGFVYDTNTAPRAELIGQKVPGFNADPEFFAYRKGLETLEKSVNSSTSTRVIMDKDNGVFRLMTGEAAPKN
jgi:membrane protease subunit HflC